MTRYSRQMILPYFGEKAQAQLTNSKVLVIGTGGLGIPVLQYLAAAGVGTLGIADGDVVEMSNLQRQVLYYETEIGRNKALIAKEKVKQLNADIHIIAYDIFLDTHSLFEIIENYDIVVDCTDHFSIRYLLNDACFLLKKPLVFASIYQYEAQLSVFHYGKNPFNLRDIFPEIPDENSVVNCNEAGVIGTLAGITGSLQANEVIKIITNIGEVTTGKLLLFDSLNNKISQLALTKNHDVFLPISISEIKNKNYGFLCSNVNLIDTLEQIKDLLSKEGAVLIDVREREEYPKITAFAVKEIPLSELLEKTKFLESFSTIVFVCESGIRSQKAIHLLQKQNINSTFYNIKNGIKLFSYS